MYGVLVKTSEKGLFGALFYCPWYPLDMNKKRFYEIAKRYRPRGVKIRFKRTFNAPDEAGVWLKADGSKVMLTPRPDTRDGLFYYLHECAHIVLRHLYDIVPTWQQEYEAEQWAIATMRREQIPVSRAMLKEAKKYVRICIEEAGKDAKVPYRIKKWAGVYNRAKRKR